MPKELIYSLIDLTMKDMLSKIEERLVAIRHKCSSHEDFQNRCEKQTIEDYTIYLFDGEPIFYTKLWFEGTKICWVIHEGKPAYGIGGLTPRAADGFICPACKTTFKIRWMSCPNCDQAQVTRR